MVKLTPRLNTIAEELVLGETMADIGTDHGYLPLYLWENGISPKIIMADISPGALSKAEENCINYYPKIQFDLRLGSGLEILQAGEVDVVVLAGMGGLLMTEILGKELKKTHTFKKLILQPRNHIGQLRFWLYSNGFRIINEKLVREGKYICEILTVIPMEMALSRNASMNDVEFQFPHSLIEFKNSLTQEYLTEHLKKEETILSKMGMSKKTDVQELRHQEHRIDHLKYLLKQYEATQR